MGVTSTLATLTDRTYTGGSMGYKHFNASSRPETTDPSEATESILEALAEAHHRAYCNALDEESAEQAVIDFCVEENVRIERERKSSAGKVVA